MNIISPSLLAADFTRLADEISRVGSARWLHIDVMDGHFVNNISVGVPVVKALRRITDKVLDVHLMIENPAFLVNAFIDAGADLICFHGEAVASPEIVIDIIRKSEKNVGMALKPQTPVRTILPYLDKIDMVLIMTVEPGFGGQSFMLDMLPKISELKNEIAKRGLKVLIQVDGGINLETASRCVKAGANVLVAGTAIFEADDPDSVVQRLSAIT